MGSNSVVESELSWNAKLLTNWSIYITILAHGCKLWVVTARMQSQIQVGKISFLHRVSRLSLKVRVRSSEVNHCSILLKGAS